MFSTRMKSQAGTWQTRWATSNISHLDWFRRLSRLSLYLAGATLFVASSIAQAKGGIPQIVNQDGHYHLLVDGSPFLMLGGQAHNSSASNLPDAENAFRALDYMHANTAEMPLSWNLLEPQPGKYDFTLVDGLIQGARKHRMKLIFLWFGTTKNATLSYVPDWIKSDRTKYTRARDANGQEMDAISPFSASTLAADCEAFAELMRHIREYDKNDHTVILMQVENETGLIGTDRDHSEAANKEFVAAVPAEIVNYISKHKDDLRPVLRQAWIASGQKIRGSWSELFGDVAPEAFSTWSVSHYVDSVAAAGKTEYPIPYYVNVALMNTGASRPGEWPSGGPTANVIDIWKAVAPHIDILAPDIYRVDFPEITDIYDRPDNPLFVPETGFAPYYAPYVFTVLAGHNGLGFAPFGIDGEPKVIDDGYSMPSESRPSEPKLTNQLTSMEENYRILRPLLPLIAKKRYQQSLFPVVLNFYRHEAVSIPLGDSLAAVIHFDELFVAATAAHRAGGIIIKLAPDQFIVAGHGFHVNFAELRGVPRNAEYLTIEEGTFDGENWVRTRVLNGDEESTTLPRDSAKILMVRLNRK